MTDMILSLRLTADGTKVVGEVKKATGEVKNLEKQARKTTSEAGGMTKALVGFGKTLVGAFAAQQIGSFLVTTIRRTEVLKASLNTVVGSVEGAAYAFEGLEDFASKTPFQIDELVDSFVKLKAFGLDPSIEAITSYGDTASAMGKSLNQVIEAVADAATGEFERLKEFGIRASSEGDKVTFTFKGVKTTVQKNAADIEKYLQNLGKTNFAGAMEARAKTLDGAISNMQDNFARLANAFGDAGLTSLFEGFAKAMGGAAENITKLVKGDGKDLPKWARVAGFTIRQLAVEASDLPDAFRALVASTVARAKGDVATLEFIAKDRQRAREDIDKAAAAYVASLEGIGQGPKAKPKDDPFAKPNIEPEEENAKERAKLRKAIEDDIKALEQEAATYGLTDKAIDLYTFKLRGATQAQLARVAAAHASIAADEEFQAALEASEEAVKAENEAYQDWIKDQRDAAEAVRSAVDPVRELRQELEKLTLLRDGGFINAEEFAAREKQLEEQIEKVKRGGDAVAKYWDQAAEGIQDSLSEFLFRPFETGLQGMLSGFVDMLHKMVSEALAAKIMEKIFSQGGMDIGSLGMSLFSAMGFGAAHAGAIVGGQALMTRNVSPFAFAGAPRFHGGGFPGLERDEVPIIARRGEEVLTRDDPRNALNGNQGGQGVRIVNVIDPGMVQDYLASSAGERTILNVVNKYKGTLQAV